jgi:hypothetical protein
LIITSWRLTFAISWRLTFAEAGSDSSCPTHPYHTLHFVYILSYSFIQEIS